MRVGDRRPFVEAVILSEQALALIDVELPDVLFGFAGQLAKCDIVLAREQVGNPAVLHAANGVADSQAVNAGAGLHHVDCHAIATQAGPNFQIGPVKTQRLIGLDMSNRLHGDLSLVRVDDNGSRADAPWSRCRQIIAEERSVFSNIRVNVSIVYVTYRVFVKM